ncbi:MAG TPA: DUF1326 domain-containing protein, partial [Acidobacteriota bacterium]|nr:DUF1326 domain-containing protein [Acidobacteriota bacterium]
SFNATAIEACSCPMFCQCYFNTKPAAHHDHSSHSSKHFCRANAAFKINKGHFGNTKLDGSLFWIADDLGPDFSKGEMDWSVLYFDKSLTNDQREAIKTITGYLLPVKWRSSQIGEGKIDVWRFNNDEAVATLDGGKTAEVRLKRFPGMTNQPVVIQNLRYWGAPRNDGFVLMPNEVEAYRVGPKAFEFKGTNGFMITVDMNSDDITPKS